MNPSAEYQSDIDAVSSEVDSIYETTFNQHFSIVEALYDRMKNKNHPITDSELEDVLTVVPLELFAVSEKLNKLRLKLEVVKLKNKETREDMVRRRSAEVQDAAMSASDRKDYVTRTVAVDMVTYEVLTQIYQCVIDIVSSRIMFSKELIMGCKKIWDGRRHTEQSMPVGSIDIESRNISTSSPTPSSSRFRPVYG